MESQQIGPLGGLAGGLFGVFNAFGKVITTGLVGQRLVGESTRTQRVLIGGVVSFGLLFAGLSPFWGVPSVDSLVASLLIGALTGGSVAGILLFFTETVEKTQQRQKAETERRVREERKSGEPKTTCRDQYADARVREEERGKQMEDLLSSESKKTESNPKNE